VRAGATNQISLVGAAVDAIEVQANAVWYEKWAPKPQSDLRFEVRFNRTEAAVNGEIDCDVAVSRAAFRGYGMLIAEIGLPPGSEVDRGTLASVVDDTHTGVDSFEVAPDHVTLYIWPRAADSKFRFVFRPRFAMKARATPSVVYDYYNPDERVALTPQLFTIQ
jgi:A-macroglobulin receptor binding domain